MQPILAMGDIAGPVLFFSFLISDGILLVAVGLLALSLWKRSLVAVVIACVLMLVASCLGITFLPLARDAFYPLTAQDFDNVRLIFWCRVVSVVWVLATMTAAVCLVKAIRKWKSQGAQKLSDTFGI